MLQSGGQLGSSNKNFKCICSLIKCTAKTCFTNVFLSIYKNISKKRILQYCLKSKKYVHTENLHIQRLIKKLETTKTSTS